jgi:glycosyltransferase involved in cell wall biosynthesis
MNYKPRIALIVSHPIQHFCPQYVSFAENQNITFKVFFASALGYKKYIDPNFKREIVWGNLNLDKFAHVFLNGEEVIQSNNKIDAPSLEQELELYAPDVIIVYGYFQKLQRKAYNWAKKKKVQIAYISDSERRQKRNRLKEFFKYYFIHYYFSKINFFLSVGDANEDFYKYYGVNKERILRMHFPIDIITYSKAWNEKDTLRQNIRLQYGIQEHEIVLCVVGKLVAWKNQDHIIEAVQLLESEGINTHLFVIGSGGMLESWKKKAENLSTNKVYFTGFVNIEDLPSYYAASDMYIHPASIEPHSIAISEAIYMGCPILISDQCGSYGQSDDVQPNKNGFVFKFGNIPDMVRHIKNLINDIELRKSFSGYSHQIAIQFQERAHFETIKKISSLIV